jgi:DNA-binding NarL/FixJ family response regulator/energy-coupling factor transporter ATP-binding protein EcfA2
MSIRTESRLIDEVVARVDGGRSVLVVGPAGIGKTTVVRAASERLAAQRRIVLAATSATAAEMPLAAFAHLLVTGEGTPAERLGSALGTLAAADGVVVIDDAHHLDPESAVLVQHLVTTRAAVVVMARRDGLALPDAIARLVRDGDVDELDVPPLDRAGVIALAEARLGGLLDVASGELLHRASGGNPLHVHELVVAARRDDLVTCTAGVWTLDRVAVRGSLAELIADRMGRWTAEMRNVAEHVASGSAVPASVVEMIAGREAVTAAIAAGVVRSRDADGQLEMHHPLVTELVRAELGPAHLTARLSALVTAASGSPLVDSTTMASWLATLAEQAPVDVGQLIAAAEVLIDQARPHAALRLAELAVGFDERAAAGVFVRATAQLGRPVTTDDPDLAMRAARGAVEALMFGIGSLDGARRALAAASLSGPDSVARVEVEALSLVSELICGAPVGRSAFRLLEIADEHRGELSALIAASGVGPALVGMGRHRDGIDLYERLGDGGPLATAYHRLQFALNRVESSLAAGRTADARIHVEERLHRIEGADAPTAIVFAGAADAQLMIAAGRPADAARHLGRVLAVLGTFDSVGIGTWAMCTLDWCCAWAGIPGPADVPDRPNEQGRLVFPLAQLARAAARAERGSLAAAREQAIALATECSANGHAGTALNAWHLATRIQPSMVIAEQARRACSSCDGDLSVVVLAHVDALAAADGPALVAVAERFAELERPALAHEAFLRAARVAGDEGRRSRATSLRAAAADMIGEGMRPTFAARSATGSIGGVALTVRESEIALAAASGESNAAIAERLGISRRTVETHLQAVYRKVGVSDRATLAALLG